MSHFTALVIGEGVEDQLEPFNENTSVEPYKSYWDSDTIEMWERTLRETTVTRRVTAENGGKASEETEEVPYPSEQVLSLGDYTLEDMRRAYMARYHGHEEHDREFAEKHLEGFEVDESDLVEWRDRCQSAATELRGESS